MRQIAVTALALAIAAGCAHRADDSAAHQAASADAQEQRREQDRSRAKRAELEAVEVSGSRLLRDPVAAAPAAPPVPTSYMAMPRPAVERNTENYAAFEDNGIQRTAEQPVSTFSIDVDTGSYSNVRRMLAQGMLPPRDAVRVEEMINYFDYGYPAPTDRRQPFRVSTELAPAPWDDKRVLMQVGLKGYEVAREQIPASNLVFLIDTSGSMNSPDKLPLLKESFRQMVPRLRAQDRVSIVVYAGSAGLVLPPTPGDHHGEILAALGQLEAGGSTNGGEGIDLAYAMARQGFVEGGVNRVILATDGDFNVGVFDQRALETKVEAGRKAGVALTTLGFGQGNYNDALAEKLADVGDGNHAYIDNLMEGRKVLVEEMGSTLLTIASDVKIQVEFNPAQVAEYRLVGYENRQLAREDFNNDQVDAGEIGAGHDVTALYELCLVGMGCESSDALRYAAPAPQAAGTGEIAFLKLRYKQPGQARSVLVEQPIRRQDLRAKAGESLRFAAAVAAYADLLRGGRNMSGFSWDQVDALARGARGDDPWGYRGEFLQLVAQARSLAPAPGPDTHISQD
ncbi:hypothetical protein GCM10011521_08650 [Arenimonas soli]|uniref:VWFA domain-containing protein n=1 Tax=Arenimonas soli TaxID=2269504 RepID=A0ABQ1HF01_9GAMM|nr:VWA domain-containing protein [Arenimonas soli]GGA72784.1 hypothetical protein GCM10011521_08650 [Arenimonas soli]